MLCYLMLSYPPCWDGGSVCFVCLCFPLLFSSIIFLPVPSPCSFSPLFLSPAVVIAPAVVISPAVIISYSLQPTPPSINPNSISFILHSSFFSQS
ncbi:hypothetical protein BZA77DRAFT_321087 [Pyronema omphalodes]|nr:hypothetical protein BZA77DRAFT_321087 [Pyronema omphalodes]